MNPNNAIRESTLILIGFVILSASVFYHSQNGKYSVVYYKGENTYVKFNNKTGEAWTCGVQLESCEPMSDKKSFDRYTKNK